MVNAKRPHAKKPHMMKRHLRQRKSVLKVEQELP